MSKDTEVAFGESQEGATLQEWAKRSSYAAGATRSIGSKAITGQYGDFDRILFSKEGLPLCYVELKVRRTPWGQYGDVIFPYRKHEYAKRLEGFNLAFVGVTRYSCGTIVEVHLADTPDEVKMIKRSDRPNAVKHAVYSGQKLRIFGTTTS